MSGCLFNFIFSGQISTLKDVPAQWAKIGQGLDIIRIISKCVCLSNGKVQENLTVPFLRN